MQKKQIYTFLKKVVYDLKTENTKKATPDIEKMGLFKKQFLLIKLTWIPLFALIGNKKETKRKKNSQEMIVTARRSRSVSQIKIIYGDFLKRPKMQ